MKRSYLILSVLLLCVAFFSFSNGTLAQKTIQKPVIKKPVAGLTKKPTLQRSSLETIVSLQKTRQLAVITFKKGANKLEAIKQLDEMLASKEVNRAIQQEIRGDKALTDALIRYKNASTKDKLGLFDKDNVGVVAVCPAWIAATAAAVAATVEVVESVNGWCDGFAASFDVKAADRAYLNKINDPKIDGFDQFQNYIKQNRIRLPR